MDLTVRGLVTIDGSGAAQGGAVAARGFDQVTEAARRTSQASQDMAASSATAQAALTKTQAQANAFAGVKLGSNDTSNLIRYGAALDQLRASYDPLFTSSRRYEQTLLQLNAIEAAAPALAAQVTAERERLRVAFEAEAVAGGALAGVHGNLSIQGMAAFHAARSMAEGVAMGIPPTQMLAMQVSHLSMAASGSGGLTGAFKEVAGIVTRLITPTILATSALVAVGGAVAYFYSVAISRQKDVEAAVAGPGRAAGVTGDQLGALAQQAAESGRIGVGAATSMAEAYVRTGKLTGDQVRQLIAMTADYAATTGQSVQDAQKDLQGAFGNLSSGVDDLDKRLNALSPAQRTYIKNLIDSGDYNKAVQVTMDAMKPSFVDHEAHLTKLGRLWQDAKNAASNYLTQLSQSADPDTSKQLADAKARLAQLSTGTELVGDGGYVTTRTVTADDLAAAQADVTRLAAKQRQEQQRATADAAAARSKAIADTATPYANSITPGFQDRQALQNKYAGLQSLMLDPQALRDSGRSLADVTAAWDAAGHAIDTYLTPAQRATQETQLATQALKAHTPEEKAAVAAAQKRLELQGSSITQEERDAQVTAAGTAARTAATYQLWLQSQASDIATKGNIALADAYAKGGAGAMEAAAHTQALTESLTSGVDVQTRARQLLTQAVSQQVAGLEQEALTQTRTAEATKDGNALVLSGAMAYGRLNDYVQERVGLAQLEMLRDNAVATGKKDLIAQMDDLIAKYPALAKAQHESQAISDVQSGLSSLSDNAPAAAQAMQYALAIQQVKQWRDQTLAAVAGVGAGHAALADQIEAIFNDRMAQAYDDDLRRRKDWTAGVLRANLDIVRSHQDMASKSEGFLRTWDQDGEEDFVNLAKTGKLQLGNLEDDVIALFARLAYERSLAGPVNSLAGGILDIAASAFGISSTISAPAVGSIPTPSFSPLYPTGVAHTGWDTSAGAAPAYRYVHPGYFDNAPRHHTGTGRPGTNELPVIVQKSEKIITQRQSDTIEAALSSPHVFVTGGSSQAPVINISVENNTGQPIDFQQNGIPRQSAGGGWDMSLLVIPLEGALAQRHTSGTSQLTAAMKQTGSISARRPQG